MKNIKNNQIFESVRQLGKNDNLNEGKVVVRYNIAKGAIEYYFIRPEELEAYSLAVERQDLTASRKLGSQINP